MILIFKGYDSATEKRVSPGECKDGHFKYDADWAMSGDGQTLTVTFSCVILINRELKGKKLQDVRVHEQRHHQDFKVQTENLKKSLLNAINKGQEPDLEIRYKWFEYDVCCKSAAYHRQLGAPVPVCIEPSGSRPQ